jgi:hypothetical protein
MNGTPRTDELGHKCAETTYDPQGDCDLLWPFARQLERELTAVTAQRDRLTEAVNAATILIAAKGRHNTMLAYNGLRDALQSLTPNKP